MKKSSTNELESLRGLMSDELRPVPEFVKEVEKNGQSIQIQLSVFMFYVCVCLSSIIVYTSLTHFSSLHCNV